jgi:hypothetical protein
MPTVSRLQKQTQPPAVQRSAAEAAVAPPAPTAAAPLPATAFARLAVHPPRANRGGLPERLKSGIEALSGVSMDAVRVHYDSHRPARLQAAAFAQGSEIHLAPGQERHLPHEAWHLVQQAHGRVRPTMRLDGGVAVNDQHELEREATVMGERAIRMQPAPGYAQGPRRPVRPLPSAVLQPYWELGEDGVPVWRNTMKPEGHVDTGMRKKGSPVFAAQSTVDARREQEQRGALEEQNRLSVLAAARALAPRRRRDFSHQQRTRLNTIPKLLGREDQDLRATEGSTGRRKAHLVDEGLVTAGKAAITATEQMDQDSVRKARGNRISSKAPVPSGKGDGSQSYGGQVIGIKARKIERARLRGKPDAQHIKVHRTNDILDELDSGPPVSGTGKERGTLKAYARKDREYHHEVGFHSPADPRHYIPNRFLVIPGQAEMHDSDSESDSDSEAEEVLRPQGRGVSMSSSSSNSNSNSGSGRGLRYGYAGPSRTNNSNNSPSSAPTRSSALGSGGSNRSNSPPNATGGQPWKWDEDYGMTPRRGEESDDPLDRTE